MKLIKLALAALLGLAAAAAFAETAQEAAVKKLIQPHLRPDAKIDSVTKTPYAGLFEVSTGGEILYTDEKAQYLFVGSVIDNKLHRDYTKERVDEINKIKFSDLPFDSALKIVKGTGKRKIAVFEDPNCGYCKQLRKNLQEIDNVTIYTFMYNILSPDSGTKSKNVWCTADRAKAWDDWMISGKEPAAAGESCTSSPNDKVYALGQKLKINGTPTIFFTDGSRIPGALDAKGLEAKLASIK